MRAAQAVGRRVSYFMVPKKAVFRLVKGNLSPCGLPSFAWQNAAFCRMVVNLLAVNKLLRCQKSGAPCFCTVSGLCPLQQALNPDEGRSSRRMATLRLCGDMFLILKKRRRFLPLALILLPLHEFLQRLTGQIASRTAV